MATSAPAVPVRLTRWLIPLAAVLIAVGVHAPDTADAVIEPIYTLPFYGVGPMVCGFHCYFDETYGWHEGVDFELGVPGVVGESVAAAASGIAKPCDESATAGNYIVLDHGNGHRTRYLHLNSPPLPSNGASVSRGQAIGYEGNTGYTVPAGFEHLHFETRHGAQGAATCGKDGTAVDPYAASTYMWTTNPPSYPPDDWSPGAAAWGCNGRLDVFARGTDNKLYQKWTDNTNGWSPQWTPLGGNITSGPSGASARCAREDIFARGAAGAIDHKWYYNGWQPWESLLGAPP